MFYIALGNVGRGRYAIDTAANFTCRYERSAVFAVMNICML